MTDNNQYFDTIIIGAGFAGLIAARDLAAAGKKVKVVEGRDRIGGRTWYEQRLGLGLELGGTWVHWTQPYVWRELNYYGLSAVPSPDFKQASWFEGEQQRSGSFDELIAAMKPGCDAFSAQTRQYFPKAFEPFENPAAAELDSISVDDWIDSLDITQEQCELVRTFWTLNFNGSTKNAAYTQALRWLAATNGDWEVMWEACASYKIAGGTIALAEAVYQDALAAGADFSFTERVLQVQENSEEAVVRTTSGEYRGARVFVTAPLEVLQQIDFQPSLDDSITAATRRGQTGRGAKVWFKLKGEYEPFMALGKPDWPLNFLQAEYPVDDGIVVIGFGSDGLAIDPENLDEVTAAVQKILPDAVVEATTGHNWVADEFAGGTWAMHQVGHFAESFPALVAGTDRIRFVGSDYALGWGGFIDGAIESATQHSRRVLHELSATPAAA